MNSTTKIMEATINTQQRLSEDTYRILFEKMEQASCILEVIFDAENCPYDYVFLEVNPMFEAQTGLKDAKGKTILELVPDIEKHWMETYGKVALTGVPVSFTQSSDVMGRWFDVSAFKIGGADSRKVALIFTDITEQKKSEEALKRQTKATLHERKVLKDFFMQAPAAFCILQGPEHVFELTNPDYQALIGNRDVIGKTAREALPEVEGQGFFELLDNVFKTGEPYIGKEVEIMLDKGKGLAPAYVNFIYQAYKDVEGDSAGILVFAYDITEQVQARKMLEQAYEDLEMKVTFRNIELERLNKEKGEKIAELERELEQLRTEKA